MKEPHKHKYYAANAYLKVCANTEEEAARHLEEALVRIADTKITENVRLVNKEEFDRTTPKN